jgi:NADP-dependent 3-hydroxy acid dehydrogenase YdfG
MNRKAVITGATKGIGRAIAEALATEGYDLAVCSRNAEDLNALKLDFADRFPDSYLIIKVVDVSQKKEVLEFAQLIINQWNRVDVLVNNAGVFISGSIKDEAEDALETMLQVNLMSAYNLTRALLPVMMERKRGYIFNLCSAASIRSYPNGGSYSISKFALLGFSKNLRDELKETGIKVTSILPGATWSDSWAGFEAPESRLMQARDIAEVVVSALRMSASAVIEEILMRPQLGDL